MARTERRSSPRRPGAVRRDALHIGIAALLLSGTVPFWPAPLGAQQDSTIRALQYGDPRNGNLYVSFLDVTLRGGAEPRIFRAYQSLSPFCGMFGCGWASDYETFLEVEGDGSVVAHEFGGGATTVFRAPAASTRAVDAMVEQITAAARRTGSVAADSVIAYQTMLRESASIRSSEWRRFVKRGDLVPPAVPVGAQFRALTPYGVDDITRTATGYQRAIADGSRQWFDADGRLTALTDAAGHRIDITRTPTGRLESVRDDLGRTLRVSTDTGGRVLRVDADSGRYAAYRYDQRGDLVWTRDTDGIVITHAYDNWHYLTRIGSADGTDVQIEYYPFSMNARVRRVTDESGRTAAYTYRWTRSDSLEYVVDIAVLGRPRAGAAIRDTISRRQHVYEERRTSGGERWMYRIAETVDGQTESTVYDEECGMPLQLVRGADTTTRTLDGRCRVSTRVTAAGSDSLDYDATDRIAYFSHLPRGGGARIEGRYRYDEAGRVTGITAGTAQVTVAYDTAGRVVRATADDGELTISRDERGRPITLRHSRFGGATIVYGGDGTPTVTPTEGTDIAVFRAYRSRLVLLGSPAGLSVDF
ncbi:MAG: DUF6531 domain-containing protein [Gemmatimonadaceae bacterium]|nr:DUF6531 domain-containing protein [Gemmatimonadaceae bacterium]